MSTAVALTFAAIVLARIGDVTLDTIRTVAVVQERRMFAAVLGFVQAVIYISVVAKVLLNIDHSVYILAYGLGFALGTYLGIAIEQRLAFGEQVASLFTTRGVELANALSVEGYPVAEVDTRVRGGEMTILYVQVPRKRARKVIREASAIDSSCFCIVNDVRFMRYAALRLDPPSTSG